jgi:hypothetical protein
LEDSKPSRYPNKCGVLRASSGESEGSRVAVKEEAIEGG